MGKFSLYAQFLKFLTPLRPGLYASLSFDFRLGVILGVYFLLVILGLASSVGFKMCLTYART